MTDKERLDFQSEYIGALKLSIAISTRLIKEKEYHIPKMVKEELEGIYGNEYEQIQLMEEVNNQLKSKL